MPSRKTLLPIALFASALMASAASAASPDAWAAFRKDVEASCRTAGAALIDNPTVTVDPFGSESYGLAFLAGKAVEDGSDRSLVCIYDKVTHKSEIGGAMALQKAGAPTLVEGGTPPATSAPAAAVAPASDGGAPAAPSTPSVVPGAPAGASPTAAPAAVAAASPEAEAALADRFASFPDDPEEPATTAETGAAAEADPPLSPQNQPVVTPPVPILPTIPAPAGAEQTPGDAADGEGETAAAAPRLDGSAAATEASAPGAADTTGTAPASFAGCDPACTATLAALAASDRKSLADLPFEIERTIARNADADLAAGPGAARAAAGAIAANLTGRPSPSIAAPSAALEGERSCVLYYFGYSNQAARSVGRHRCSVSAGDDGTLLVEKVSGERLRAELKPLTSGVSAFVGRTFKTGQAETRYDPAKPVSDSDKDLGNSVGLATASEGRVMLTSSELRRFEGEDNFFWVLAIDPK